MKTEIEFELSWPGERARLVAEREKGGALKA
jgi:hypothetical protein